MAKRIQTHQNKFPFEMKIIPNHVSFLNFDQVEALLYV
jgi:hypothetical protein